MLVEGLGETNGCLNLTVNSGGARPVSNVTPGEFAFFPAGRHSANEVTGNDPGERESTLGSDCAVSATDSMMTMGLSSEGLVVGASFLWDRLERNSSLIFFSMTASMCGAPLRDSWGTGKSRRRCRSLWES